MDGIDVALLESDGEGELSPGPGLTIPYDTASRAALSAAVQACAISDLKKLDKAAFAGLETQITELHAAAVQRFSDEYGIGLHDVDVIGFHGHTLLHRPDERFTWQIGDGRGLSVLTGRPVVYDFRSADVAAGGEGAPLAPVYHRAIAHSLGLDLPCLFLNLGGVGNVTWIGRRQNDVMAFDTGPANALLDDWVKTHRGLSHDDGGKIAAQGCVDDVAIEALLKREFFVKKPPKSLDRQDFNLAPFEYLSLEDGAATLTAFSAACVERGLKFLPVRPQSCIVMGGGRHNPILMKELERRLGMSVTAIDALGLNGDFIEAHAFAYMAIRRMKDLPISYPGTTGVPGPMVGGIIA